MLTNNLLNQNQAYEESAQPLKINRRRLQRFAPALLEISKDLISAENAWQVILPDDKRQALCHLLTRILGPKALDTKVSYTHSIGIIWTIEDVQSIRPDLTEEQATQVLEHAKRKHDASMGINWEVLECIAQDKFGDIPEDFLANDEE